MSRKQEQGSLSLRGGGRCSLPRRRRVRVWAKAGQWPLQTRRIRVGNMGFSRGINYRGSQGLKRVATKHKDHAHRLRAKKAPVPKSNCRDARTAQS